MTDGDTNLSSLYDVRFGFYRTSQGARFISGPEVLLPSRTDKGSLNTLNTRRAVGFNHDTLPVGAHLVSA